MKGFFNSAHGRTPSNNPARHGTKVSAAEECHHGSCHVQQTWLATSCSFSRPFRFSCSYRSPPAQVQMLAWVRRGSGCKLELGHGQGGCAQKTLRPCYQRCTNCQMLPLIRRPGDFGVIACSPQLPSQAQPIAFLGLSAKSHRRHTPGPSTRACCPRRRRTGR